MVVFISYWWIYTIVFAISIPIIFIKKGKGWLSAAAVIVAFLSSWSLIVSGVFLLVKAASH